MWLNRARVLAKRASAFIKDWSKQFTKPEKILIFVLAGIALISGPMSFFAATNPNRVAVPAVGGSMTEGIVGEWDRLNPLYAPPNSIDKNVTSLVFSGLLKINQERELVSDLASSWEVSSEGQVYTFHLRENVTWHDGEPFNADDVLFTGSVLGNQNYVGPFSQAWNGVRTERVDDYTVRFHLPDRNGLFPFNATVGMLPEHVLAGLENPVSSLSGNQEFNTDPVGTGPFQVADTESDEIVLERNPNFYKESAKLTSIRFRFFDNESALQSAISQGNITAAGLTSPAHIQSTDQVPGLNFHNFRLPQYRGVFFNQSASPILSELEVRRALAYATDKQKIVDQVTEGYAHSLDSPVLPGFWGHLSDMWQYDFNLSEAARVLSEEGWTDVDGDGILERNDTRLSVEFTFRQGGTSQQIAELLAEDWRSVGFEVSMNAVESDNFVGEIVRPRQYQILLFGQTLDLSADPYVYWHSSQSVDPGLNLAVSFDKDIDNSLEEARLTVTKNERISAYHQFQQAFNQVVPAVLLYQPSLGYFINDKVKGLDTSQSLSERASRFVNVADWYLRTQSVRVE